MIKTALIAMTLMGCDCDARLCEFISESPPQWQTVADCEAAMSTEVRMRHDLDFPLISGFCRYTQDAVVASAESDGPAAPAAIVEEPGLYDRAIGGGRIAFRKTADGYHRVREGLESTIEKSIALARWSLGEFVPSAIAGSR